MATHVALEAPALVSRSLHLPVTSDPEAFGRAARATERILVTIDEPARDQRDALARLVITTIERELAKRGAAPATATASSGLEAQLSDALYRTRLLGAGGLALRFSSLAPLADAGGRFGVEDSDTLRELFSLAERESLQLYLPERDARLRVLGAPQRLAEWLTTASRTGCAASIEYELNPPRGVDPGELVAYPSDAPPVEAFTVVDGDVTPVPPPAARGASPASAAVAPVTPAPPSVRQEPPVEDAQLAKRCAAWAAQLQGMSGPKVHGSIERAFVTAYLPLSREVATGKVPKDAVATLEKWAEGFAQSYATAFKTLHMRAKRPKMVRDVVEVAVRWLSHYRARQCQLLMVDGLRFDLGQRMNEELEQRLGGRAQCVDQTLLWAALPSNGDAQQIGEQRLPRPTRTLRAKPAGSDTAAPPASIESMKVGSRELFRLDALAPELSQPGELEGQRLDRLATALGDVVAPWLDEQPADTLVVLFGNYGFHWTANERGTTAAQCGGALPEQVLVPASAWLRTEHRPRAPFAAGLH